MRISFRLMFTTQCSTCTLEGCAVLQINLLLRTPPADWDMFSSRHVAADIHAAARAVSGGPVYVSDAPGPHRQAGGARFAGGMAGPRR